MLVTVYGGLNLKQPISRPKIVGYVNINKDIRKQIVRSIFECTQAHNFMQRFSPVGPSSVTNTNKLLETNILPYTGW